MRDQRNKLGEKIGKSPKKGKKNKKSALKSKSLLNETDDAISAYTGYTTELDALIKDQDRITDDFFPHQGKARDFFKREFSNPKATTTNVPTLSLLEIDDYDETKIASQLYVNVRRAINRLKV